MATKKAGKKKELELATMGMSSAEFGEALIREAQTRKHKANLEKSVTQTQTIFSSLDECNRQILYFTGWKQTLEEQLAALKAGEFFFDSLGALIYNKPSLNRK